MMTNLEVKIKLNEFQPRDYQKPVFDAFINKGYRKLMCIWPRRCLHGDTHITMADGSFKKLKDIIPGDRILSWNGKKFVPDFVKHKWETGFKNTVRLQAQGFLPLVTSYDHRIAYSCCGRENVLWKKASELTQYNLVHNYAGIPPGDLHDPDLAEFYGYLLTDGYVCDYQQPKFTNTNIDILNRVEELALKLFKIKAIWREKGNGYDLGLTNGTKGGNTKNRIKELFRKDTLDIPKSRRPLPTIMWSFDEESLLRFFAAVISCDGNIYCHEKGFSVEDDNGKRNIPPSTEVTISCGESYDYAWGLYWLLRKMSIVPQVPYIERSSNWKVKISKNSCLKKLLNCGVIYGKISAQDTALRRIESSTKEYTIKSGCYRNRCKIAAGKPDNLYDIEAEKNHNFLANGYLVHNSGKDLVALQLLLDSALRRIGIYYMIYPTYNQAKKIVWDGMTNSGKKFLSYIPAEIIENINSTEMKIILKNGSLIQLVGSSDSGDRIVGSNPVGIVFSEYALSDPACYAICRPMLNANDGWSIIISTPRGHNDLYRLYEVARNTPEWFVSKLTLDDTKHIPHELIDQEVQSGEISRDLSLQEYWTSFSVGQAGSFWGTKLDEMRLKGQIGRVPYESHHLVSTSWDIGLDTTAIIFFQVIGSTICIVDYYENQNLSLDHYINVLKNKPYTYNKHIAPHDMANREFSSGVSRLEMARRLDVRFTLAPNLSIADGIDAVKAMLAKVWIDESACSRLISCIEHYRQSYDEKKKTYTGKPEHDQYSHGADALRMLAVSLPKVSTQTTPEELEKRYREAYLGPNSNMPSVFRTDLPDY